jgi:Holliday junction resolvase-like predicted endonuclease
MATEYELLNSVNKGGISRQRGKDADFEEVLMRFLECNAAGYFAGATVHRESQTAAGEIDLIAARRLSASGSSRLSELQTKKRE